MIYDLIIESRRASDPRITMRGLTFAQLMAERAKLQHWHQWWIRPIDADQPRRLASPLVCYAWSPTGGAQSLAARRSVACDLFRKKNGG